MNALHIRYNGQSLDIEDTSTLDIGDLSNDSDIRVAVARHLGVPEVKMQVMRIERNTETGDITLRPEAVFGGDVMGG